MERDDWTIGDNISRWSNPDVPPDRNQFSEPDATQWELRGTTYLVDRKKVPSASAAFETAGVNVFRSEEPLFHAAQQVKSLREFLAARPSEEFFIFSWVLPGPPYNTVVELFRRTLPEGQDPAFDKAFNLFKTEGDDYQKSRFKFLCGLPDAPWALRATFNSLGGLRPVIICKKISSQHFMGPNYIEIDVNVASSKVASSLNSIFLSASARVVVDLACTIEGQSAEELPERIFAAVRWHFCAIDELAYVINSAGEITAQHVAEPYMKSDEPLEDLVLRTTSETSGCTLRSDEEE